MKKLQIIGIAVILMFVSICDAVFGAEQGKGEGTADLLKYDVKKATVAGANVVEAGPQSLQLKGTNTNNWGTVAFPDSGVKDIEVSGTFNIAQPGTWYGWFYGSYFPLQYHYATEQPGYDLGVMIRQENRGVFYRVLFSTKWNEVALWKEGEPGTDPEAPSIPSGFFAMVKKVEVKQGQDYAFSVKVIGNKLQVLLDGKPVLAYDDKVLPLEKGGWGFGIFNGATVKVSGLELKKAAGEIAIAAKKHPDFRVEDWHGENVVFDGDEPIMRMPGQTTAVECNDVKFKPGYRAQMSWPFVLDNDRRASYLGKINCTGNEVTVVFAFPEDEYMNGKGTMIIGYDPKRDTYVYEIDQTISFIKDNNKYWYGGGGRPPGLYYENAYFYNPMPTTDKSLKISRDGMHTASSPYRMALVKWTDGTVYRWPIHHSPPYNPWLKAGFDDAESKMDLAKDLFFILYPEPVVCPTTEIISMGEDWKPYLIHCCMVWDMHFSFVPMKDGKRVDQLKAGDSYREKFRIMGYPRAEADKLKEKSKLLPSLNPDIECPWYVPGMNDFSKGGNVEQCAGREIWQCGGNVKWEKTVGHNDNFSLKLVNSVRVNEDLFGYNDEGFGADEWEISAWIKADQWKGAGIRIGIRRLNGPYEGSEYIPIKPGEWQKISYTGNKPTGGLVYINIETSGEGTCWVDDVEFKKLKP